MPRFAGLTLVVLALSVALPSCGSSNESSSGFSGGGGDGGGGAPGGNGGAPGGGVGGVPSGGGSSGTGLGAAGGVGGAGGSGASGGGGGVPACVPMPSCNAPLPSFTQRPWKSTTSSVISATGFGNHRGRDLILTPEMDQWVLGKFAYGVLDKDIHGEEVDLWLDRDCAGTWQQLGTAITTNDGDHATVEGVDDTGGRVYFQIPVAKKLGIGRHRVYMVVAGDLTGTEQYIEVMPAGTVYFVSDVDGTLTTSESVEYTAILTGTTSDAHPDAAKAFSLLASKHYRPYYLTARPEFLVGRTREFVRVRGFPLGPVHTTLALGATGGAATSFKKGELDELHARGFASAYAFGNTSSDADAFFQTNIDPVQNRIFFQFTDAAHGGRRIDAYSELLGEFGGLSSLCP